MLDAEVPGPAAAVQQDPAGPRAHLPPPHRGQAPAQGKGGDERDGRMREISSFQNFFDKLAFVGS